MKQTESIYQRIAGMIFTALTILVAALLILQCADIYASGVSPENVTEAGVRVHDMYSREIVGERFSRIAWAVVVWAAMLVTLLVFPGLRHHGENHPLEMSAESRLALLLPRIVPTPAMLAERRKRRSSAMLCGGVCALCGVMIGLYLFSGEHFASRDLEKVMGEMMLHVAPWIVVAFGALAVLAAMRSRSINRELQAAREAQKKAPQTRESQKNTRLWVGRALLCAAAVALIIAGISNGGMYDVLVKAVNICTECIGLG